MQPLLKIHSHHLTSWIDLFMLRSVAAVSESYSESEVYDDRYKQLLQELQILRQAWQMSPLSAQSFCIG